MPKKQDLRDVGAIVFTGLTAVAAVVSLVYSQMSIDHANKALEAAEAANRLSETSQSLAFEANQIAATSQHIAEEANQIILEGQLSSPKVEYFSQIIEGNDGAFQWEEPCHLIMGDRIWRTSTVLVFDLTNSGGRPVSLEGIYNPPPNKDVSPTGTKLTVEYSTFTDLEEFKEWYLATHYFPYADPMSNLEFTYLVTASRLPIVIEPGQTVKFLVMADLYATFSNEILVSEIYFGVNHDDWSSVANFSFSDGTEISAGFSLPYPYYDYVYSEPSQVKPLRYCFADLGVTPDP